MRFRLRSLLILLAVAPPLIGWWIWPTIQDQYGARKWQPGPPIVSSNRGRAASYGDLGVILNDGFYASGINRLAVTQVSPRSPAATGGLMEGDIICSAGNLICRDFDDFDFVMEQSKGGTKLPIVVERNGKVKRLEVTLGKRPGKQ